MTDTQPAMNRRERVEEVLRLEGLAVAARARAGQLRAGLEEEARSEYDRDGTAPTWRVKDIGNVILPVSQEAIVVADPAALLAWCRERRPDQVHTVEEVYASFQGWLTGNCSTAAGVAALPDTGEVVPGLAVRPGGQPGTLSLRPGAGVRRLYQQLGEQWLDGAR